MIHQKKGGRALWAVAFAAAPIGAHAGPIVNPPSPGCDGAGQLSTITWQSGSVQKGSVQNEVSVGSPDGVISARVHGLGGIGQTKDAVTVPFECTSTGYNLTQSKLGGLGGAKTGGGGASGSSAFARAEISKGDSFSIDFGQLHAGAGDTKVGVTKNVIDFVPTFTAFDYTTTLGGTGELKDGGSKDRQVWVTDFNLDLNATNRLTGEVLYRNYLGVQVISGASALSGKDAYFLNDEQLIFDPSISGPTWVNLLSSPDPRSVPEPASLALMAAGLLGIAAATRRRKTDPSGGGEPEA